MLNDFHMMLFAILASQGGIAVLLVVMARLEPTRTRAAELRPRARPGSGRPAG